MGFDVVFARGKAREDVERARARTDAVLGGYSATASTPATAPMARVAFGITCCLKEFLRPVSWSGYHCNLQVSSWRWHQGQRADGSQTKVSERLACPVIG
ncbi:MAG: hypothetical protein NW215_00575 [Hyphomicrobiales bacterium]|nr:hypothetical protein [Hyphomicrobiales bacterium]